MNADYPRFDGGASGGPMGAPIGGGNYMPGQPGASVSGGAAGGAAPGGQFNDDPVINALGGGESGNSPGKVNSQGYSGQFQFGAARLDDLGLYQPAQGENLKANTFQGQFNIPGFPGVQTYGDFLANGPAQRAAMHVQAADIENAIANTPGASRFDPNGLIAVAHLGGVGGMQKFVQTGGAYNPADSNGTHLSDYYSRYSQLGRVQLAADHGHPDGPLPGYTAPNAGGGVQVASTSGTAGMPATATDAGGAPSPTDIMNASLDRLRQQQGAGQPSPGAPPARAGCRRSQRWFFRPRAYVRSGAIADTGVWAAACPAEPALCLCRSGAWRAAAKPAHAADAAQRAVALARPARHVPHQRRGTAGND